VAAVPELPEVETIRRELEKEVLGKRIRSVTVADGARVIRRHRSAAEFVAMLDKRKVEAVERRGKYLLLRLDAALALVVHLGMSGQLLWAKSAKEPTEKHTHVVLAFVPGSGELRFVDPRTFGELFVTAVDQLEDVVPELAHLGFDPLDQVMSWIQFRGLLVDHKTKLKPLLMDQRFVAGIGNIYSDEILFDAGLRWDRSPVSLTPQEVRRLYRAIQETLQNAIRHKGSSLADEQYRDLFGEIGAFQRQHNVYDREGQPCRRCRTPIVRVKVAGRSSFMCPRCQV
jgi:formamidopyrimidine-DNA glycosylase